MKRLAGCFAVAACLLLAGATAHASAEDFSASSVIPRTLETQRRLSRSQVISPPITRPDKAWTVS